MALHWEHVKGFNGSAENKVLYTYLEYKEGTTGTLNKSESYLPNFLVSKNNEVNGLYNDGQLRSGLIDFGHIITSDVNNTFTQYQTFNHKIFVPNTSYAGIVLYPGKGIVGATSANNTAFAGLYMSNTNATSIPYGTTLLYNNYNDIVLVNGNYTEQGVTAAITLHNNQVTIGLEDWTSPAHLKVWGHIDSEDYCQASYFNATSDARAKENLQPIPTDMLDIVKQIEVYTFNYKNHPQQKSLGILAQDVQHININGFSLIENPDATGTEGDYMSIRESKLVYILLEAVKELSAKVEALERELYASK